MTIIADDLFAGAGGWDLAARDLGIHARGVENMPEARRTRDKAGLTTVHDDVWTFADWLDEGLRSDDPAEFMATLLIASPPCQTFSQAGSGSGRKALDAVLEVLPNVASMSLDDLKQAGERFGDDRTALVLTPLWYALHYPYRALAWEQVPTVLPVWEACAEVLREHGWNVWTGKLHSEQHGTPQTRTRAFLLASLDHEVVEPTPTHSKYYSRTPDRLDEGVPCYVTMAQALGWDDDTEVTSNYGTGGDPAARGVRRGDQPAATVTSKAGRNKVRFAEGKATAAWVPRETTPDGLPRFAQQSDNEPDYGWPDRRPSTTVAGRGLVQAPGATANRYNGSTKSRNDGVQVSVAEAGVLQGFPADYPWQGRIGKQYLQAGNAVPPPLAKAALGQVVR